jgi:adenylate kinase
VIAGIQGSGKNVQGTRLKQREHYDQFVTSAKISENPALAAEMQRYKDAGKLAPDEVVMGVVQTYLAQRSQIANVLVNGSRDQARRSIWDGMPRTRPQKRIFDAMVSQNGREAPWAVKLDISDETAWSNIAHRAKQPDARSDDGKPDVIRKRIATYHEETRPVLDAYGEDGRLIVVDAEPGIDLNEASEEEAQAAFEAVYARLVQAINERTA